MSCVRIPSRRKQRGPLRRGGCRLRAVLLLALALWGCSLSGQALAYRFVVMGDSPGASAASPIATTILGQINQRVAALSPPASFVVFLGDNSFAGDIPVNGAASYTFQNWLDFMRSQPDGLPAQLPMYLVVGNRELSVYSLPMLGKLSYACQQNYQAFVSANASQTLMPGITSLPGYENLAYSFTSPDNKSLFVVLDGFYVPSAPSVDETDAGELDANQLNFLQQTLAGSTAKSKFVVVHNPAFSPANQNYNTCVSPSMCQFWQIVNDNNVSVVFNGHIHLYSRVLINSAFNAANPGNAFTRAIPQIIPAGGGGALLGAPDEPGTVYAPASWNVRVLYNYSVVDVDNSGAAGQVTVRSYCSDGNGAWSLCDTYTNHPYSAAGPDLLLLPGSGGQ